MAKVQAPKKVDSLDRNITSCIFTVVQQVGVGGDVKFMNMLAIA